MLLIRVYRRPDFGYEDKRKFLKIFQKSGSNPKFRDFKDIFKKSICLQIGSTKVFINIGLAGNL